MKKNKIPKGLYCYTINAIQTSKDGYDVTYCPYSVTKDINGVNVHWCDFLNKGDSHVTTLEDLNKLIEYYGSEDAVYENLTLDLLWDDCKSCGENY